jgi:O-antigen ligase
VSLVWSIYPTLSGVSAFGLLVYLVFGCLIAEMYQARTIVMVLIWSLAGYGIVNWLWATINPEYGWLDTYAFGSLLRLQGISGHPNFLGGQMAMLMCLLMAAYNRAYLGRGWFYAILGLSSVTLLATQSRTAAASLVLSLLACRYRRAFLSGVAICLALLTLIVITGYLNVVTSLLVRQGDGDFLAGRDDIWEYMAPKMADRPLLGYGFNVFGNYYIYDHPNMLNPESPLNGATYPSHPHNSYLEVLFSGGIITLLPFMAWTALLVWRWWVCPDYLRDLVILWIIFGSMTEIGVAGPPSLETLLCFVVLGIDHAAMRNQRMRPS